SFFFPNDTIANSFSPLWFRRSYLRQEFLLLERGENFNDLGIPRQVIHPYLKYVQPMQLIPDVVRRVRFELVEKQSLPVVPNFEPIDLNVAPGHIAFIRSDENDLASCGIELRTPPAIAFRTPDFSCREAPIHERRQLATLLCQRVDSFRAIVR